MFGVYKKTLERGQIQIDVDTGECWVTLPAYCYYAGTDINKERERLGKKTYRVSETEFMEWLRRDEKFTRLKEIIDYGGIRRWLSDKAGFDKDEYLERKHLEEKRRREEKEEIQKLIEKEREAYEQSENILQTRREYVAEGMKKVEFFNYDDKVEYLIKLQDKAIKLYPIAI